MRPCRRLLHSSVVARCAFLLVAVTVVLTASACSAVEGVACWVSGDCAPPAGLPFDSRVPLVGSSPERRPVPSGLSPPEALELRRVQQEHLSLIASIPTPVPTVSLVELAVEEPLLARREVGLALQAQSAGLPQEPVDHSDWFDPARGLYFYQPQRGDWTLASVRASHPYRDVFYFRFFPDSVPGFYDESIYRQLARELAFEASDVMPVIGEPDPILIGQLRRNLGWQIRDPQRPVVNVWSLFTVTQGGFTHSFAVGGVNQLAPLSWEENGRIWEYLALGEWLGPVVVERLE